MVDNYTIVTELPGYKGSKEQLSRLYHRYHFALQFCKGKEVLEVACGGGMGLAYLEQIAKKVLGGDIDEKFIESARERYKGRKKIELKKLNAQSLPFPDKSFDVVILYEAIYYLAQPEKFVDEAFRVLRPNSVLLVCSVNKEWCDFNPSPFSTKYFNSLELYQLLTSKFSDVKLYGAFPIQTDSRKSKIVSLIKRTAMKSHLMPKTMKGKEFFKRIFFGRLMSIPPEIKERMAEYIPPVPISKDPPNSLYKVLYAVACNF